MLCNFVCHTHKVSYFVCFRLCIMFLGAVFITTPTVGAGRWLHKDIGTFTATNITVASLAPAGGHVMLLATLQ